VPGSSTTAAPFAGLRVALVAKFNRRYHHTGYGLAGGLRGLGCEVVPVELRTRGLDRVLRRTLPARLGAALAAHRPAVVLVFKGAELAPEAIAELRPVCPALWLNWFPDPADLLDLSLRLGAAYDGCFLFDSYMVDRHRSLGRRAEFLALGFDPEFHRPPPAHSDGTIPIVFVGSREPFRELALAALADLGLQVWGPDRPRGPLYGDDLVRAFSRAEVALNIHRFFGEAPELERYGTGANQRVFELAAIGTAQLCDAKADIGRCFVEDQEIVLYQSLDELRAKAKALLQAPQWRASLARRARARALREHTWRHRLEELLTVSLR